MVIILHIGTKTAILQAIRFSTATKKVEAKPLTLEEIDAR